MAETTEIAWCDSTFNPWIGCAKISPGCNNCYAARQDAFRHWTPEGWGGPRKRTKTWGDPVKWNAAHEKFFAQHGRRQRVFCASLADVFDNEVPKEWRTDLFGLIRATPNLDWLLLTKRIGNVQRMAMEAGVGSMLAGNGFASGLPGNVWLGATMVNQEEADRDIPKLLATPAAVRFLSVEPMLGPIDLRLEARNDVARWDGLGRDLPLRRIAWVICGGESGPGARPMQEEWARSLARQCKAAGVAFFMKQLGGVRDKRGALEDLPEDLRTREFP